MKKKPPQLTVCYEVTRVGKVTYSPADTELIINCMLDNDCEVGRAVTLLIAEGKIADYPEDSGTDDLYECCYYTARTENE